MTKGRSPGSVDTREVGGSVELPQPQRYLLVHVVRRETEDDEHTVFVSVSESKE